MSGYSVEIMAHWGNLLERVILPNKVKGQLSHSTTGFLETVGLPMDKTLKEEPNLRLDFSIATREFSPTVINRATYFIFGQRVFTWKYEESPFENVIVKADSDAVFLVPVDSNVRNIPSVTYVNSSIEVLLRFLVTYLKYSQSMRQEAVAFGPAKYQYDSLETRKKVQQQATKRLQNLLIDMKQEFQEIEPKAIQDHQSQFWALLVFDLDMQFFG